MTEIERENRILCEKMRSIYLTFNPLLDESILHLYNLQANNYINKTKGRYLQGKDKSKLINSMKTIKNCSKDCAVNIHNIMYWLGINRDLSRKNKSKSFAYTLIYLVSKRKESNMKAGILWKMTC